MIGLIIIKKIKIMKNKIKYRGKTVDTGKWVFGHYFIAPLTIENFGAGFLATPDGKKIDCISQDGVVYQVDPVTVGQYAFFSDTNGKDVFEDDVVRVYDTQNMPDEDYKQDDEKLYKEQLEDSHMYDQVVKQSEYGGFFCDEDNGEYCPPLGSQDDVTIEIIGNIHDNKDLIKK